MAVLKNMYLQAGLYGLIQDCMEFRVGWLAGLHFHLSKGLRYTENISALPCCSTVGNYTIAAIATICKTNLSVLRSRLLVQAWST